MTHIARPPGARAAARRAAERFLRSGDEGHPDTDLTPEQLVADELTRRTVPNRAARRAAIFGKQGREAKRRASITRQRFELREAKRAAKAARELARREVSA